MGLERMSCEKIGGCEVCGRPTLSHLIIDELSSRSNLCYTEWRREKG